MNKIGLAAGIAAGVVALGAAGYAGTVHVAGNKVQAAFETSLNELKTTVPALKVTKQEYSRSFFGAVATTVIEFGCGESGASNPRLEIRNTIQHGPFASGRYAAALVQTELVLPPEISKELGKFLGNERPTLETVIGMDGSTDSQLFFPGVKIQHDKGAFQMEPIRAGFNLDGSGQTIKANVDLAGLSMSEIDGPTIKLGAVQTRGESRKSPTYGWLFASGTGEGRIASISASGGKAGAPGVEFALNDLTIKTVQELKNDLIEQKISYTGSGKVNGKAFEKFEMEVGVRRIYVPPLVKVVNAMLDQLFQCKASLDDQAMLKLLQSLEPELKKLAKYNPEYGVDKLAVTYAGHRGEIGYTLGLENVTDADFALPTEEMLKQRATIKAKAKLPIAWLKEAMLAFSPNNDPAAVDAQLAGALQMILSGGFATSDGTMLSSEALYRNGVLTVNGKPMPIPGKQQ